MLAAVQPPVVTAVPAFGALARVQDKISAHAMLDSIGLPQPRSLAVGAASDLDSWQSFPTFWKAPIGTATSGIRLVRTPDELCWEGEPFLLQERVEGPLVMAQSVFDNGRLVASASNLRVREGAGGGASHKRSADQPHVREHLAHLGEHLAWHGALSADVIVGPDGPMFIDINPRWSSPPTPVVLGWTSLGRSSRWRWAGRRCPNLSAWSASPPTSSFWRCSAPPSRTGVGSGCSENWLRPPDTRRAMTAASKS